MDSVAYSRYSLGIDAGQGLGVVTVDLSSVLVPLPS